MSTKNEIDIVNSSFRLKVVISSLKICEVAMESLPQMATQWAAVYLKKSHSSFFSSDGFSMSALQCLSISTSTLTIIFSIVSYISRNRRHQWIRPGFPPAASLLPLGCLTLAAVLSGTIPFGMQNSFEELGVTYMGYWENGGVVFFCILCLNSGSALLTIFTILTACRSACCKSRCCKVIRTLVHLQ